MTATFAYHDLQAKNLKEGYVIKLFNDDGETFDWYCVNEVINYSNDTTKLHVTKKIDNHIYGTHFDFVIHSKTKFTRRQPVKK